MSEAKVIRVDLREGEYNQNIDERFVEKFGNKAREYEKTLGIHVMDKHFNEYKAPLENPESEPESMETFLGLVRGHKEAMLNGEPLPNVGKLARFFLR